MTTLFDNPEFLRAIVAALVKRLDNSIVLTQVDFDQIAGTTLIEDFAHGVLSLRVGTKQ